jgi:uncharacterized phage-associated protein
MRLRIGKIELAYLPSLAVELILTKVKPSLMKTDYNHSMLKSLFKEKKAAQVAAYFLMRSGGELSVLKLMKLMYLSERSALQQYGEGIVGDRLVSMPHGPVMSLTLNCINGENEQSPDGWDAWVADRANHMLALKDEQRGKTPEDLLALSLADEEVMSNVWQQFGRMTGFQLRDYTHTHCPEWKDPDGSMIPMQPSEFFMAVGLSPEASAAYVARMHEQAALQTALR